MDTPRTLLLAGAAHGIGRAIAVGAAAKGFSLALCDIDEAALEALKSELPESVAVMTGRVDITQLDQVAAFAQSAMARFGAIDAAVCNAGGMTSLVAQGQVQSNIRGFLDADPGDWKRVIDLNLTGALNVSYAVLPAMTTRGRGRLVLVSSVSGLNGDPGLAVYSAAKAGVITFTRAIAREVAASGVRVNSVAPGGIATRAFEAGTPSAERRLSRIPVGRMGLPEEIADVVLYLAADAPDYLTGETIAVAGGPG